MNRCPIVLAVLLAASAALAHAAEDGVAVHAHALSLVAQGRLQEAEATLRRAVSIDEGITDAAGRARLVGGLDLLASLVGNRGERAESESLLRRALALANMAPRLPDADVAHAVVALGQALAARGAGREAEKLASRGVKLYEKTSPPQRAEAIDALNLVAALHASRGDPTTP